MAWSKPKPGRHPQEIAVSPPQFCGEQDGPPERELKERLAQFFERDQSVKIAYLANVIYGGQPSASVALCLRTQFGRDRGLAEKIGGVFASIFGPREYLDIIFLDDKQEAELAKICAPFFG